MLLLEATQISQQKQWGGVGWGDPCKVISPNSMRDLPVNQWIADWIAYWIAHLILLMINDD